MTSIENSRHKTKLNGFSLRPVRQGQKLIRDYPVLHRMLTNLFDATYQSTLAGKSAKLTFGGPELISHEVHGNLLGRSFWEKKIGSYRIQKSFAWIGGITLYVLPETIHDIFVPDMFYLIIPNTHYIISITDTGEIKCIEMYFDKKMPQFTIDLIRDFPEHNCYSERVFLHRLAKNRIGSDAFFLKKNEFSDVKTIEVE